MIPNLSHFSRAITYYFKLCDFWPKNRKSHFFLTMKIARINQKNPRSIHCSTTQQKIPNKPFLLKHYYFKGFDIEKNVNERFWTLCCENEQWRKISPNHLKKMKKIAFLLLSYLSILWQIENYRWLTLHTN